MKPKKFSAIDETRVIDIEGDRFLVWSAAWNYKSEMQLFSAYPEVVRTACMESLRQLMGSMPSESMVTVTTSKLCAPSLLLRILTSSAGFFV